MADNTGDQPSAPPLRKAASSSLYLSVVFPLSSPLSDLPLQGPKPCICKQVQWVMIVVSTPGRNLKRTRALNVVKNLVPKKAGMRR